MTRRHRYGPSTHRWAGRALPLLLCVVGVLVLTAAGLVWWQARPAPDVGASVVTELARPSPSPAPGKRVPVRPADLPGPDTEVAPVGLSIPSLKLTASVVPTGVDRTGQFDVPPSVDTVGWYRFGPGVAATSGSIVIGGHVDSATQGEGAFFRLRELSPGDTITLTGPDSSTHRYTVVARERHPKKTIDLDRYFGWTGSPRLTLITCGGTFDRAAGSYRDNIVVTAKPA